MTMCGGGHSHLGGGLRPLGSVTSWELEGPGGSRSPPDPPSMSARTDSLTLVMLQPKRRWCLDRTCSHLASAKLHTRTVTDAPGPSSDPADPNSPENIPKVKKGKGKKRSHRLGRLADEPTRFLIFLAT